MSRGVRFSLQTQATDLCPRRPTARRYLPLTDSPDPRRGGSGNELLFCGPRRFFPMRPQPPRREAPLGGEGSGTSSSVPKSVTAGASGTWGRRGAGAAALVGDGHAAGLAGSPRGWRLLRCPPRSGDWLLGQTAAPAESPALGSRCLYSPWRVISLPLSSPWYQPCPIPSALNPWRASPVPAATGGPCGTCLGQQRASLQPARPPAPADLVARVPPLLPSPSPPPAPPAPSTPTSLWRL